MKKILFSFPSRVSTRLRHHYTYSQSSTFTSTFERNCLLYSGLFAFGVFSYASFQTAQTDYGADSSSVILSESKRNEKVVDEDKIAVLIDDNFKTKYEAMIESAQDRICEAMAKIDGNPFLHDDWERPHGGGGGRTRVLQDGNVFEKAGVNVSVVHGKLPPSAVRMMKAEHKSLSNIFDDSVKGLPFYACGLSLVIHPHNPMAPTIHLNYRFFEVVNPVNGESCWWFGGGSDLTPTYLFEDDTVLFHQALKDSCDTLSPDFYEKYKKECDNYFVIKHRNERRGVGGIFFDDIDNISSQENLSDDEVKDKMKNFQEKCLNAFIESYSEIMQRRKDMEFNEDHKRWQQLRRGRYVEFNLVYDRGTKFGLYTPNARIESILMSLPLTCRFEYAHVPEEGSDEDRIMKVLKTPRDWLPKSDNESVLSKISTEAIVEELVKRDAAQQVL